MVTEEELTSLIEEIIEKGDLNDLTVKKIFQQLEEKFPTEDLSTKKDFIRNQVKELVKNRMQQQRTQSSKKEKSLVMAPVKMKPKINPIIKEENNGEKKTQTRRRK